MKFNYKLKRLCGSYYGYPATSSAASVGAATTWTGANVEFDDPTGGNFLLSAACNRIQVVDLKSNAVRTLPVETRSDVRCMAMSPDGSLLVTVDVQNYLSMISFRRGVVLHRMRIGGGGGGGVGTGSNGGKVRCVKFSPCGRYVAFSHGKRVQVWCAPSLFSSSSSSNSSIGGGGSGGCRQFCPMVLHRTYTGQADDVTCLAWSSKDSSVLAAGSRDGSVRVWTLHTVRDYVPASLAGHRRPVVGVYLVDEEDEENRFGSDDYASSSSTPRPPVCYSVSEDGAVVRWTCESLPAKSSEGGFPREEVDGPPPTDDDQLVAIPAAATGDDQEEGEEDDDDDFFAGSADGPSNKRRRVNKSQAHSLVGRRWSARARNYFHQEGATVTCTSCNCRPPAGRGLRQQQTILAVGFSWGLFGLYELPGMANLQTLSVGSRGHRIRSCALNTTGEWLALGCPDSQQLLVWEWQSETYVLKQRGHASGLMRCVAYSPDGVVAATGGEDGKVKLWNAASGFCYVTIGESGSGKQQQGGSTTTGHTAPITAVTFASSSVVLSASLDGTVRAHDLYRYRTFRTFTTPTPVQFLSLACDPSGEVVCAGTADPFHVYVWNLQTAKLLDVLTGHAAPVCALAFKQGGAGTLVSGSWDGTVRVWDVFGGGNTTHTESLRHASDVVCVACRPDGKEICAGTVGGLLSFWDVENARLKFEIDGRRDIAGGRKVNDRQAADNNAASRYFTSVAYSADGTCVLAGGNSKYVCIYEVSQQILLKKFQVTYNRSFDGVLDELNSKLLGDGGPIDDHADSGDEAAARMSYLPGAKRGDDGSRRSKVEVLTRQVAFSSTGREWAAVSGEGLHVYSLDEDMIFDPISLTEEITPAAIESKIASREFGIALRMAIHLNEFALVKQVLEDTPYDSIPHVVRSTRSENSELERLMQFLAKISEESPHIEFYLQWSLQLLQVHGAQMDRHRGSFMRAFRSLHRSIQSRHDELKSICDENKYALEVLNDQAKLALQRALPES